MSYYSKVTEKGNSSWSDKTQKHADEEAKQLDDRGCTDCTDCMDCTDCVNCMDCTDCTNCANCTSCMRCMDCTSCTNCTGCVHCMDCMRCMDCTSCMRCMNCAGTVIQAGMPNGWHCYGFLKNEKLIIHCGCRISSLVDARAYWAGKENRREVLAAVEYIATVATIKGWKV